MEEDQILNTVTLRTYTNILKLKSLLKNKEIPKYIYKEINKRP